jgi:MoxR-like ATPase
MSSLPQKLEQNIARIFRGKDDIVRKAVLCILAEGHLLIEDIPGVGKTTLALALSKSLDLTFQRIQFTSDLLPSDILGVSIFNSKTNAFEFKKGPIFRHIVLADEINRSTPKTQSALLEAMNERQVSMDNETRPLPRPFFVIATQNPYEHYGTYPLPESQRDRFLMRLSIGYPAAKHEKEILREEIDYRSPETLSPVTQEAGVLECIEQVRKVRVDESIDDYILSIIQETRQSPFLDLGASPRGSIALHRVAQANAFLEGRSYAIPDDVKTNAAAVLSHRVILKSLNGDSESAETERIVREIVERAPVPT